jgi:hypothetical protein
MLIFQTTPETGTSGSTAAKKIIPFFIFFAFLDVPVPGVKMEKSAPGKTHTNQKVPKARLGGKQRKSPKTSLIAKT